MSQKTSEVTRLVPKNESGLHPKGRAVLVRPYQPERKEGMIVIPESIEINQQTIEQRAVVIEAGPEAWIEERVPRAVAGEKVLISAYAGYMAKGVKDGVQYRFVNDRDIFAGIED